MKILRDYQLDAVEKIKSRLKEVKHPLCVDMSVGAGKSLCISAVLLWIEKSGYRALCLTMNSTLIDQNSQAYKGQNGSCGIYCAALNSKDTTHEIIFGSPQSVCNGIRNQEEISRCKFNIIIIDECHNISHTNNNSLYMRIFNHFGHLSQSNQYSFRIIGLSGTCYRGKGESIVGEDRFFKEKVCEITAPWLIERGYLVNPHFGNIDCESYNFSNIRINNMGKFNHVELSAIVDSNERLTGKIMRELTEKMQTRVGCFVFASSRRHCIECAKSLPEGSYAIITAETNHNERKEILLKAKLGEIRFLISVNCLNVGVDIQNYDTCAWLRPTESLIIYIQGIGRVLRLSKGKTNALILDYAQNLIRHGDLDNLIINEALQPKKGDEDQFVIPCLTCSVLNKPTARRCIGLHNNKRCEHYFEWKDCKECQKPNDKTSRYCWSCNAELIDPNAKLSLKAAKPELEQFEVIQGRYWLTESYGHPQWNCMYQTKQGLNIYESFHIRDSKMKNWFYGAFIRNHVIDSSQYYPILDSMTHLRKLLESGEIRTPHTLGCSYENNRYKIKRRHFHGFDTGELSELPHLANSTAR